MKYGERLLTRLVSLAKQELAKANVNIVLSTEYFDRIRSLLLTPVPQPTTTPQRQQEQAAAEAAPTDSAPERIPSQGKPEETPNKGLLSKVLSGIKTAAQGLFFGAAIMGTPKNQPTNTKLKEIITGAEGTTEEDARARGFNSAYDVPYGYGQYLKPDKPLSTMTLDEVDAFQIKLINATRGKVPGAEPDEGTSAVGKYQIIRPTLKSLTEDLPGSTIFSAQLQEKLASKLIAERIKQGGGDTKQTVLALSQEFASLPMDESGRSFYGQPVGTTYNELAQAIEQQLVADKIIEKFRSILQKPTKGANINSQGDPEPNAGATQIVMVPMPSNENAGGALPPASAEQKNRSTLDNSGSLRLRLGLNAD